MSTPIVFRASTGRPCPVCATHSKGCSATEDGLHLCRGEPQIGWYRIGGADDAGFFHYRRDEGRRPEPVKNWREDAERYARNLTNDRRRLLSERLGLPVACLQNVPLLGYLADDRSGPCFTFPEHGLNGEVTAINRRYLDPPAGSPGKKVMHGGCRGVYLPVRWRERTGPVLVPEGGSDVLALCAVGLTAIGRPNDRGGAEIIAGLLRGIDQDVIVLAENDLKPDGKWPGKEGAEYVARKLASMLGRPVKWALPPTGLKDARAWVGALARDVGDSGDWPALGARVLSHLEATARTIAPASPAMSRPEETGELIVSSLKGIEPEAVRFLVPGYVPAGMMGMIAGEGGHGKSMTTLELAAALSVGRCAFGLSYPNPVSGKTLLVSCEDDWQRTIVPRLAALGADFSKVLRVEGVRAKSGGKAIDFHLGHFNELERQLTEHPDIRLVVVDPAGAYIGRAGVNENHDADLRAILGPLSETANRTGATVLLIKHLNKSAGASAVQRVGGSTGYVNAVRFAYMVAPDPDEADKKLMLAIKANVLPSRNMGLAYRLQPVPMDEATAIILREWPSMHPTKVADLAGQLFRQAWEGSIEADVNAVAGAKQGRGTGKEDAKHCEAFIRTFLGAYAWPDEELEKEVKREGFSFSTLKATKTKMRALPKNDPQRLSSKAHGEGGKWWQWIGSQYERPADRPISLSLLVRETGETERLEGLERLKTEGCADGADCDTSRQSQSIQSVSSSSLSEWSPSAANQRDCPPVVEERQAIPAAPVRREWRSNDKPHDRRSVS